MGYVRPITNEKITKIAEKIYDLGYMLNQNGEIAYKAEFNSVDIANLRKTKDFEKRILKENSAITCLKVSGKANRRNVEKEIFVKDGFDIADDEFLKIMRMSAITAISDVTEDYKLSR